MVQPGTRQDLQVILELLDQPYELDPASLGTLADFALQLSEKSMERLLFSALAKLRSPETRKNLTRLLQSLVEARPRLSSVLKNSIKPAGRCAAGARRVIVDALGLEAPSLQRTAVTTSFSHGVSHSVERGEILLDPATTSLYAIPALFDTLAAIDDRGATPTLRVREFVYASGLALVATWANARGIQGPVLPEEKYTNAYLKRIGFVEALRGIELPIEGDPEDWSVRLTIIAPGSSVEHITAKIVEILGIFVNPTTEDRQSFGILLGELIENVKRHASARTPGFIVAQVYPKKYRLGITIADAGIGIRRSFLEGEVEKYKNHDWKDSQFIKLAMEPLVTSKVSGHAGYGLYILAELVLRNVGTYMVSSGAETVIGFRGGNSKKAEVVLQHSPWKGTVVTMILNLQNKLPLGDVYRTLPMPEGYTEEDFFDA